MTLIVGHRHPSTGRIDLVGDTRTTWDYAPPEDEAKLLHPKLEHATLKLVVTVPTTCVGFSGTVPAEMHELLGRFPLNCTPSCTAASARHVAEALSSTYDLSFLIGFTCTQELWKVEGGESTMIEAGIFGWIGDAAAFSRFQEEFKGTLASDKMKRRMETALASVVDSHQFRSVGGFPIAVKGEPDHSFKYEISSGLYVDPATFTVQGRGGLMVHSPSGGEFMTVALQGQRSYPAVSIWFPQSGRAIVLAPLVSSQPVFLEAPSPDALIQLVHDQMGIELWCPLDNFRGLARGAEPDDW